MRSKRVVVLASGSGTNLSAIIEAVKSKKLFNCEVVGVVSNFDSTAIKIAINNKINVLFLPWERDKQTRENYDLSLVDKIQTYNPDLIVLAGWNHILTEAFINKLSYVDIINLHPALLGEFPGNNAIEDAWNAYQKGSVKHTGIMVHKVTSVLDVGEVIHQKKIEIKSHDNVLTLRDRIQTHEKGVLIHAIQKLTTPFLYRGKVKDVYKVDNESLLIVHTDRLSASNRYVCDIEGKGHMLCRLSNYFFNATQYIIPNHIIDTKDNCMLVHKCEQIPIEFIMRAYITGSLWKTYSQGNRKYCGVDLPDGLKNNQRLDYPILTPTTKDEFDLPISVEEIVEKGILSQKDLDYISDCVYKLFVEGQYHSKASNLILVDTKYEFGRKSDGTIVLIDEIHTIESSRYWKLDSYEERYARGESPEKLDKDCVRDFIKTCPDLNDGLKTRVLDSYISVYNSISKSDVTKDDIVPFKNIDLKHILDNYMNNSNVRDKMNVVILSGSQSDSDFVDKIKSELVALKMDTFTINDHVCSAHKSTPQLLTLLNCYKYSKNIYITVAGMSNALSGVVACNTSSVVIACPPLKTLDDLHTNIQSSLQMPSNVPVMTILKPRNVALTCQRIINLVTI